MSRWKGVRTKVNKHFQGRKVVFGHRALVYLYKICKKGEVGTIANKIIFEVELQISEGRSFPLYQPEKNLIFISKLFLEQHFSELTQQTSPHLPIDAAHEALSLPNAAETEGSEEETGRLAVGASASHSGDADVLCPPCPPHGTYD